MNNGINSDCFWCCHYHEQGYSNDECYWNNESYETAPCADGHKCICHVTDKHIFFVFLSVFRVPILKLKFFMQHKKNK